MKPSLRLQLSLTIVMIVLLTVSIIGFCANGLIKRNFEGYIMQEQTTKIHDIISNAAGSYNLEKQSWDEKYIHGLGMYALSDGYILTIKDKSGQIIWSAEKHDTALCHQTMAQITERMQKTNSEHQGGFTSNVYALKQAGQEIGSVAIEYYGPFFLSEDEFAFLRSMNIALLVISLISMGISLIAGAILAKWIARPVSSLADISRDIAGGNYDVRFKEQTRTKELEELVGAVNDLAISLAYQENLRKQMTQDVGHELRTPLTTVASYLEMMIEGVWEPTEARLQSCREEIERLTGLVANIEQLATVEGENVSLKKSEIDLLDVAQGVVNSFAAELDKHHLQVGVNGTSVKVWADRDKMTQVMMNLISNAIKYSKEHGRITITQQITDSECSLTIADDGLGIPKEEQDLIFERFYRADKSRNRKTGGAGLGLAIVKSIIEAHGGHIAVESEVNQGSRFIMTMPLK